MSKNPCDLLREALVIIGSAAPYTWNAKDSAAWSERAAAFDLLDDVARMMAKFEVT